MKLLNILIGAVIGTLATGATLLILVCNYPQSFRKSFVVDLPAEYPLISNVSAQPDSMVCWISNDTIHFRFNIARRNFPNNNN